MNRHFSFVLGTLIGWAGLSAPVAAQQVAIEVRILKVPDSVIERLGLDRSMTNEHCAANCPWCPAIKSSAASSSSGQNLITMNDIQLYEFMESAQEDPHTSVMQAPKMTVMNGQTSDLNISDQHLYVTHVDIIQAGGQTFFVPKNEPVTTGFQMSVQPTISSDRKTVQLAMHAKLSDLEAVVPLFPITTIVGPTGDDAKSQPVPVTQYLQQPQVNTIDIKNTMRIADGQTAVLGGWKNTKMVRKEFGPPTLSKIPYVDRVFKKVGYGRESENVLFLVTPRIIVQEEVERRVAPGIMPTSATVQPPVVKPPARNVAQEGRDALGRLLYQYRQACSEGRLADASQYAIQALALDPTCFTRHPKGCASGK
jgi:type II secretory pathway component GspD/PulD (secretin)